MMSESDMINAPAGPEQEKRFASGMKAACTPVELSQENRCGVFRGSGGVYQTTLTACECVDFRRRKQPCKHMYRLAVELGVLEGNVASDKSQIVDPRPTKAQRLAVLEAAVDKLEQLDRAGQDLFHEVLRDVFYRKKPNHRARKDEDFAPLLALGLVVDEGKNRYSLDPALKPAFKSLSLYLSRRNEDEWFYDGEEWGSLPKGVHQAVSIEIGLDGARIVDMTDFPDDEITALLTKHGVNRMADRKGPTNQ